MRKAILYLFIAALIAGGVFLYQESDHLPSALQQYVENGEFVTFKARFTPEQIMQAHKGELLEDNKHSFGAASVKYYPYLLMEIKYVQPDKKTREGVSLWSMVDGEMVLDTSTWEITHGFQDAIEAQAIRNDYKLMQVLAKTKSSTFERLQKDLGLEKETLQQWIKSALDKHLIVQKGGDIQLHFQNPKIAVLPETKMGDSFVKQPYSYSQHVAKKYTTKQIQNAGKAAFGSDFTVRSSTEVFLPVYAIEVKNPDGSILTTYWNALNGERMTPRLGSTGW